MRNALRRRLAASGPTTGGAALVAAVAVALIGIMLVTVVVANAVAASRDSGRGPRADLRASTPPRARSTRSTPSWRPGRRAPGPPAGPLVGGTSPSRDDRDGHGAVLLRVRCAPHLRSPGMLSRRHPASAVVTATATARRRDPKRTVQSEGRPDPVDDPGQRRRDLRGEQHHDHEQLHGRPRRCPDTDVDVWVDGGNVNCNSNVQIKGNLIVVNGTRRHLEQPAG